MERDDLPDIVARLLDQQNVVSFNEVMDTSCQEGTVQTGGTFIMTLGVFLWHGLGQ